MKIKNLYYISLYLLGVTIILFLLQNWIVGTLSDSYIFYYPTWTIYVFLFLITLLILSILYYVSKVFPKYVGFAFMGFILFKMIAAVVFLIPLIKMQNVSKIPDFTAFFVPYFIYLLLEIMLSLQFLKQSES